MGYLLLALFTAFQGTLSDPCDASHPLVCQAESLMLGGDLDEAVELVESALGRQVVPRAARVELHLIMSRVLDRIGLHYNTRPVEESLDHVRRAEALLDGSVPLLRARVELEKSGYFYRAEMNNGEFSGTVRHAEEALRLFERVGDWHGQADAVHRLGLVHLQRRELDEARKFFDRSLELDNQGGSRAILKGDYERHVGFLYFLDEDVASALPYFERSLRYRREGGLIDQSMFAAETYASALMRSGRVEEAKDPILFALMLAERLDSPVGKARVGLTLGGMYEQLGDIDAAIEAYEMTQRVAESVGYLSVSGRAVEAIERLRSQVRLID